MDGFFESYYGGGGGGGGASIPVSRVSLTNLGFNELPHLTNQNLSPLKIGAPPLKERVVNVRTRSPWTTTGIMEEKKRHRRKNMINY